MSHTFSVAIPEGTNILEAVDTVHKAIVDAGGVFAYDMLTKAGSFAVKGVTGGFTTTEHSVTVTITKKPFIVSNGYIEKTIRDYFQSV